MSLTLRLRQEDRHPAGQTSERQLDHGRLVLGRGAESDWVLIDSGRTISKRHCVIEKADLGYAITDLSANGVFINDEDEPVGVGNTRKLQHGDRIRIGPYLLLVELAGEERPTSPEPTSLELAGGPDSVTELSHESAGVRGAVEPFPQRLSLKPPGLSDLDLGAPIDEFLALQRQAGADATGAALASRPADSAPSFFGSPEEWAKVAATMAEPGPAPSTNPAAAPTSTSTPAESEAAPAAEVIAAFCDGAGLDPSVLTGTSPEETMRQAGELLRIAVEGLMTVLASRRTLKSEFRLSATEFRPVENNPLKFSVSTESAMQMLIGRP